MSRFMKRIAFPCEIPFGRQVIKHSKSESLAGLDRGSGISNRNSTQVPPPNTKSQGVPEFP